MRFLVVPALAAFACAALAGVARSDDRPTDPRCGDEVVLEIVPDALQREEDGPKPLTVQIRATRESKGAAVYKRVRPFLDRKTIGIEVKVVTGQQDDLSALIRAKGDVPHKILIAMFKTLKSAGVGTLSLDQHW